MKCLKDYPLREWLEAADGCEFCGAKYEVQVTLVDESGDFGEVSYRIRHQDDCPERYGEFMPGTLHSGLESYGEVLDGVGWKFSHRVLKIAGREWPTLKSRANIGPCLSCWKLVVGVPLILWPEDGEVELDFCFKCAEELGILETMLRA